MNNTSDPLDAEALAGRWKIESWIQHYDDGRIVHPMGETLMGFVHYGKRFMSCSIARQARPSFETGGQWNAQSQEKARAYDSYLSYWGEYEVSGDVVIHHVRSSLFPNWEGGVQRRTARLTGSRLDLSARLEEGSSQARTAVLVWEREPD